MITLVNTSTVTIILRYCIILVIGSIFVSTLESQRSITDRGEGQEASIYTIIATANTVRIQTPDKGMPYPAPRK
jgi:hypothetical protein